MQHQAPRATGRQLRRWPAIAGAASLALGILLGLAVLLLGNGPLELDAAWMDSVARLRSPVPDALAQVLNLVGSGWGTTVATFAIAVVLLVLRRSWTALYATAAVIASALAVHGLKAAFGRPRPVDTVLALESAAFPSGHVAYAAALAVVIAVAFWRRWVVLAGVAYVILMAISRTYLGAHWVTDTVGGLLFGAGVSLVVLVPFARWIWAERVRRAPESAATSATL